METLPPLHRSHAEAACQRIVRDRMCQDYYFVAA